jgi:predicted HicB family RNase H-like nuclease
MAKTDSIQLRVEPHLKAAAEKAAKLERRSLSNWIEVLIEDRCKQLNVETTAPDSKENPV